jgi:hypothetical protein
MARAIPYPVTAPDMGIVSQAPPHAIPDRAWTDGLNVRFRLGRVIKVGGYRRVNATALSGAPIVGAFEYVQSGGTKIWIVGTTTRLFKKAFGDSAFVDITGGTPLTGTANDFHSFATHKDTLIITNGVDAVKKWTGTGDIANLGGSPPVARVVEVFQNHVVLGYISGFPNRIQWSDLGNAENWSGGEAGSVDFVDDPGEVVAIRNLRDNLMIYKSDAIYVMDYCVAPETRILRADLRWVRADELRTGDALVAFDEERPVGRGQRRKFRTATVVRTGRRELPCLRIVTDKTTVTASEEHMFLCAGAKEMGLGREGVGHVWVKAKDLRPGMRIAFLAYPWEEGRSHTHGYLRGIADGEGYVAKNGAIGIAQNPGIVFDEIHDAMRRLGFSPRLETANGKRITLQWQLSGIADCLRFLGEVRPSRLLQRAARIYEGRAISGGQGKTEGRTTATVLSVDAVGIGPVVTLETTTKTVITEGLLSHNTGFPFTMQARRFALGTGAISRRAVAVAADAHYFVGWDRQIYRLTLAGLEAIGTPVQDRIFGSLNYDARGTIWAVADTSNYEVLFGFPTSTNLFPDIIWPYNYAEGKWHAPRDISARAAALVQPHTVDTWDAATGSWNSDTDIWDAGQSYPVILHGTGSGFVFEHTAGENNRDNDAGVDVAVNGYADTKWFTFQQSNETLRHKELSRIGVTFSKQGAYDLRVTVYTADFPGETSPTANGPYTVKLDGSQQPWVDVKLTARAFKFRFQTDGLDQPWELWQYEPYIILRGLR